MLAGSGSGDLILDTDLADEGGQMGESGECGDE